MRSAQQLVDGAPLHVQELGIGTGVGQPRELEHEQPAGGGIGRARGGGVALSASYEVLPQSGNTS